jgi:hypothetical protein
MTRYATISGPRRTGHVLRVIEFDVEVFIKPIGKRFPRRVAAVDVLVTD